MTPRGVNLLRTFEGTKLAPYKDSAGYWTIGTGHLIIDPDTRRRLPKGDAGEARALELYPEPVTKDYAELLFLSDIKKHEAPLYEDLVDYLDVLEPNQLDALTCFVYNVGMPNYRISRLRAYVLDLANGKAITAKQITDGFLGWIRSGGVVVQGLINRRKTEAYFFNYNELKFFK